MQENRRISNLCLIGFMGTGKTSVARLASELLQFSFLDTDDWIQAHAGCSVSDIFQHRGEAAFREMEREAVRHLEGLTKTVIATGGGLAAQGDNLENLKKHSLVVCLWASPEKIWDRVKSQSHRPLLNDSDPKTRIRQLLAQREPFYKRADILMNTELRTIREVAQQVVLQFRLAASEQK